MSLGSDYIASALAEFTAWRNAIRHILETLPEAALIEGGGAHSIAVLVRHLHRAQLRRWTDPFADIIPGGASDQWKEWESAQPDRAELVRLHEEGWDKVQSVLASLDDPDLERTLTVRGGQRPWLHALIFHWSHYAYHYGQIVAQAKIATQGKWKIADAAAASPTLAAAAAR